MPLEVGQVDHNIASCHLELVSKGVVQLTHPDTEKKIFYTTDGSDPMLNGELYTNNISILDVPSNKGQAYIPTGIKWRRPTSADQRFIVFRFRPRGVDGRWGPEEVANLPVSKSQEQNAVSIITDPSNLFDPDTGIYVTGNTFLNRDVEQQKAYAKNDAWWIYPGNYSKRGKEWEREGYFEFFGIKDRSTKSKVGIRVNGNMTRAFADRSIRVSFQEPMGYPFFSDVAPNYSDLILRNGGNDRHRSKMRDVIIAEIARTLNVEVQASRPVSLYVNGVYWGVFQLRERANEDYFIRHFGMKRSEVAILEDAGSIYHGKKQDSLAFFKAIKFAESTDLDDESRYRELAKYIDVLNFIDYMAIEMFFANTDWPQQNVKMWRMVRQDTVSPWRWMLNDLDLSFGYPGASSSDIDMFEFMQSKSGPTARLFKALMESQIFRRALGNRFVELLKGPLSSQVIHKAIDVKAYEMSNRMPDHIARWGYPSSINKWNMEVDKLRVFASQRPIIFRQHVEKYLLATDA